MRKRLFIYTCLITIACSIAVFCFSISITNRNNQKIAEDAVIEAAHIYKDFYDKNVELSSFVQAGERTRVTVISSDGEVLEDTRPISNYENHLDRPEVQAALNDEPSVFVRYSESLGVNTMYYALKVDVEDDYIFIRTSIPVASIDLYLAESLPVLILVLIANILVSFFVIKAVINRITRPFDSIEARLRSLAYGDYDDQPIEGSYPEIDMISREIKEISSIVSSNIDRLKEERDKAEHILNSISEGLIVVNSMNRIQLINTAALAIFNVTADITGENLNYLTYNNAIGNAVKESLSSDTATIFELSIRNRTYFVTIKPLSVAEFTIVTLTDVEEFKENARRREEFFANASHELKTPLSAIKGFNELAVLNNKDEKLTRYLEGISKETQRMISLISDMLMLSELETSTETPLELIPIALGDVVEEVIESLDTLIQEKALTINVIGEAKVNARIEHLYELVKNILENAVRYNKDNGSISIAIEAEGTKTFLFIFDNGIGISPEEQTRIFERFYRVEKSRSSRNGGTGLGLAIVKHICTMYRWDISLKSTLGVGTEVSIVFN